MVLLGLNKSEQGLAGLDLLLSRLVLFLVVVFRLVCLFPLVRVVLLVLLPCLAILWH